MIVIVNGGREDIYLEHERIKDRVDLKILSLPHEKKIEPYPFFP